MDLLPELVELVCTVIQVVHGFPFVFKVCAASSIYSILYYSCQCAEVANFFDIPNLYLIFIHVWRCISPPVCF